MRESKDDSDHDGSPEERINDRDHTVDLVRSPCNKALVVCYSCAHMICTEHDPAQYCYEERIEMLKPLRELLQYLGQSETLSNEEYCIEQSPEYEVPGSAMPESRKKEYYAKIEICPERSLT